RAQRARAQRGAPHEPRQRHRPPELRDEQLVHQPGARPARAVDQPRRLRDGRVRAAEDPRREGGAPAPRLARCGAHRAHARAGGVHRGSRRGAVQGGPLPVLSRISIRGFAATQSAGWGGRAEIRWVGAAAPRSAGWGRPRRDPLGRFARGRVGTLRSRQQPDDEGAAVADEQVSYNLEPHEQVTRWYNVVADLPTPPPPPLHPATHEPVGPDDLAPLFPIELIMQEVTTERYVDIPEPVLEVYRQYRSSPLIRARAWEKKLGTPARIYVKYEGVSPAGSHKVNTAVPQVYYNSLHGIRRLTTETGAGQWGTALAYASALFGVECEVWQVGASFDTKPQRRTLIEVFGGKVHRSPSRLTESGKAFPADHPGSLGIAISE